VCSKSITSDKTIGVFLTEYKNYTLPNTNITENSGEIDAQYHFSNDSCATGDNTCIQKKKNLLEQEINPILGLINVTINWNLIKWII
jgi:hypothetical protein